jgi:hypothetical protein
MDQSWRNMIRPTCFLVQILDGACLAYNLIISGLRFIIHHIFYNFFYRFLQRFSSF